MYKIVSLILSLFLLCSCSFGKFNNDFETYDYDFQLYGYEHDKIAFKAITVDSLKNAIDQKKSGLILISTPSCSSCRTTCDIINELGLKYNVTIYNIDPNSSQYPVFNTDDFADLVDILNVIGIDGEGNFNMPIFFILKNGKISSHMFGLGNANVNRLKVEIKILFLEYLFL